MFLPFGTCLDYDKIDNIFTVRQILINIVATIVDKTFKIVNDAEFGLLILLVLVLEVVLNIYSLLSNKKATLFQNKITFVNEKILTAAARSVNCGL